jgi:hypothetical protein
MDCPLSHLLLSFRRTELTVEDTSSLDAHLALCPACRTLAQRNAATDRSFLTAMIDVPVPAGLQNKLMTQANARLAAVWRQNVGRWVGVAVLVLIPVVAIGSYGWLSKPTLDTRAVASEFDQKFDFAADRVPAWLREQGISPAVLDGFDLRLSSFHGRGTLLGREVPTVMLQNGAHLAQIYVISENLFHLDADKLLDSQSSRGNVTVFRRDGKVLVVAFTSETLAPFLMPAALNG